MSEPANDDERMVLQAIARVKQAGTTNLRDRMNVAALCKANGDILVADWILDNPRVYAGLIASNYNEEGGTSLS